MAGEDGVIHQGENLKAPCPTGGCAARRPAQRHGEPRWRRRGLPFYRRLPLALRVVGDIMENPKAKDADRSKVAMAVLDRAGLRATAETRVTMGLENDTETLARIKLLAERNGIPLAQLLGARHAKMIEGAAIDVTPEDDEEY